MSTTAENAAPGLPGADSRDGAARALRVAHVIGRLSIGGAEKHFVTLLNALDAGERFAVLVAAQANGPDLSAELDPEIALHRLPVQKRTLPVDIFRLARFFRRHRIDVVHTHMFWSNLYGAVAARLAGVPVIVTTEHGENRWKRPLHRWLERNVISRLAQRRFCVSPAILDNRRTRDRVPAETLELVANGTPLPPCPVATRDTAVPVIGSIGRFAVQKNFPLFVDLIAALNRRGHPARGVLAGDGPEMPAVRERAAGAGLGDRLALPGFTTDTDRFFRGLDCYVVTSAEEGQPVSLLEAMSYGLPIVATDVGAISQTLASGREGLVVPPGDLDALATAVIRFLEDPGFARACGSAARRRIERDYSIDAVARRYEERYRQLLRHRRRSGVAVPSANR